MSVDLINFHPQGPPCLHHLLRERAERDPLAAALFSPNRAPLSYKRLNRHVEEIASQLHAGGIARHDRVAMVLPDGPELATAFLAVSRIAACAPLNPSYRQAEFDAYFADLNPRLLLVQEGSAAPVRDAAFERGIPILELAPALQDAAGLFTLSGETDSRHDSLAPIQPEDIALLLHTSGTSARSKVVPLTHRNLYASASQISKVLELTERDCCLNVMPLFHIHGLSTLLSSLVAGASIVCIPAFSGPEFFPWMQEFKPTWYSAAPTIHQSILEHASRYPAIVERSSLRFLRSASSAMPRHLITALEEIFRAPFVEAYGMTEAAPQIASNRLPPHTRKPGSVGQAAGPEITIRDEVGQSVPIGQIGEIVIRGENVVSGYESDTAANESAWFDGWFRTGDLGYLDDEGDLFITGRAKEIINRGGEKISPFEVEEVLGFHPEVAACVAFAVPHPSLGEGVAAAIVLREGASVTENELRCFAAERLAHFKVPQQFVFVKEIPLGATGKLQRIGLAEKLGLARHSDGLYDSHPDFAEPRTPTEERLAKAFAGALGIESIGIHHNFFQLGGDSLTATQALVRLQHEFGLEVPLQRIFEHPTVAELAAFIAESSEGTSGAYSAQTSISDGIQPSNATELTPLSFAQGRVWFLDQIEPGNPAYNMHAAQHLRGELDIVVLEQSLSELLARHAALRTSFPTVEGTPVQMVSPIRPVRAPLVDLSRLPVSEREAESTRLAAEEARHPFHLGRGPLFRVLLLRLDRREHVLLLTIHHIVCDGWSMEILYRELGALYQSFSAGHGNPLPELPLTYSDYAQWQRRYMHGEVLQSQLAYWKEQLKDSPPLLALTMDRPRPPLQSYRGARIETVIPAEVVNELRALGRREGATLFMTMLAAFQLLLSRYSGQDDIAVGAPIANRNRAEIEGIIGFFANTLVLRTDLSGSPSFRELLAQVRTTALGAYAHQELPFEKLVEELSPERDLSHTPLFQVMFAFQNVPSESLELGPGLEASALPGQGGDSKFDLTLYLTEQDQDLAMTWQYSTDLFEAATIERMAEHFRTLLEGILVHPERNITELSLLTEAERRELLAKDRQSRLPQQNGEDSRQETAPFFHHYFEEQAARTPDALAVACEDGLISYGELNERANQLAHFLRKRGVEPGTPVALHLTRSVEMLVAILGVFKAGGAYVPLDPSYPDERLAFMLQDACVSLLLTQQNLESSLPPHNAIVVCLEAEHEIIAGESRQNFRSDSDSDDFSPSSPAYVIYTSGSTGVPKGVIITHANLHHYVRALQTTLGITSSDRWLHTASFSFSSSVRQYAVPLSCGASVVIASPEQIHAPQSLFELIRQSGTTILDIVPSYWRACEDALLCLDPQRLTVLLDHRLRLLLSASEPLPWDLPTRWAHELQRGEQIVNMFGQTETTGIALTYSLPNQPTATSGIVPIGRPIAETQVYLLDGSQQPVPVGVAGEVYIAGPGVGAGYLNQPELTATQFEPDPFSSISGTTWYKTGDRGRYRSDGSLEFLGRQDRSIKLRGFRIDPAEIEFVAKEHPVVRDCVVVARSDNAGAKQLAAYVVPRSASSDIPLLDEQHLVAELHQLFERTLPRYSVPAAIVVLAELPRTPNGKIDWSSLPAPERTRLPSSLVTHREIETTEKILSKIWSQILKVDSIGIHDNFFDMGGDSILSIQMIARASKVGIRISPNQIFQYQTIQELVQGALFQPQVLNAVSSSTNSKDNAVEPSKATSRADVLTAKNSEPEMRVTLESLRAYGCEALEKAGLSSEGAAIVAEVQLEASLRGQPTHNMGAIPRYARRIAAGLINPRPHFQIERETASSALLDGDNGPGQWVATVAMKLAIEKAKNSGVGIVGVRRSNHFGAAGHYAWMAARQNLIGLCTTNGALWLAPTGGLSPTFGNNPLGVGIPTAKSHPVVLDVSMSVTAKGKIGLHLAEGKPLEAGWIFDQFGLPSTDVADMAAGLGVPIGGYKGYGLTLVMEVLAGVLTGAGFCGEHERERMRWSSRPPDFGHSFIVINPELFTPLEMFTSRIEHMLEQVKNGNRMEGVEDILLPGEVEMRARERNLKSGVPLGPVNYRALLEHRAAAGLKTKIVLVE